MNKLSNDQIAFGAPGSPIRESQLDKIAQSKAEDMLQLPTGHTYGKESIAARFVEAFVEGARWQRTQNTNND